MNWNLCSLRTSKLESVQTKHPSLCLNPVSAAKGAPPPHTQPSLRPGGRQGATMGSNLDTEAENHFQTDYFILNIAICIRFLTPVSHTGNQFLAIKLGHVIKKRLHGGKMLTG